MTRRLAAPSAGIALLLFLFLVAPPLEAADRDLDRNTVLLLSTENWPALRAAIEASDDGRFLKDPKIQEIINRLQNGFLKLMESGMKEAGAADDEMKIFSQFSSICGEACETLCKAITGRASFSAGFREDSAGGIQPQFIFQCQGGEEISALHRKVLDFFLANDQENELRRTSLRIGGVEFQGFDVVKEHAAGPVVPPDGIYFGHKDGVHTVGISKAGLEEYLSVAAGGKTAAGGRLGDDPLFKRVLAQVGKGELFSFLNARPIWKLLERHHPSLMEGASGGAGGLGGAPDPAAIVDALGLRSLTGMASSSTYSPRGATAKFFVGLSGRQGFFQLLPAANTSIAVPPWVPDRITSLGVHRMRLDKILDVVYEGAAKIFGEGMKAEIAGAMGAAEAEIGISVPELLSNFEGTMATYTPPSKPAPPSIGMMMVPGANTSFVLGMKVKDRAPCEKLFTGLAGNEGIGALLKKEEFLGRTLHIFDPSGDTPPEFAPQGGGLPQPALALEGSWLLFAMSADDIKNALRAADSAEAGRIVADKTFQQTVARVGSQGCGLGYQDLGKTLASAVDSLRPLFGMIPLMLEGVGDHPELLFLFNPQNLPPAELLEKYYGLQASSWRLVDGGIFSEAWWPSKAASEQPSTEKEAGL